MNPDDTTDTAAVDDAESEGDFASGFAGVEVTTDRSEGRGRHKPLIDLTTKPPTNGKADPAQDAAQAETEPPPELVQITKKEWDEIKAAASRTASYDSQFSKLFGTLGNVTKQLSTFQTKATPEAQPAARKVEISKAAFAEMEKDFPELAQQTRAALEAALSGLPAPGANDVDVGKIEGMLASYTKRREIEALEDAYPEWLTITGAVGANETPDPENPFRKWLSGKDAAYQDRINGSESAAVIGRAIRLFQRETAAPAPAKPNGAAAPRDTARADRIRAAVQPRGDNAGSAPTNTSEEAFAAGFSRT